MRQSARHTGVGSYKYAWRREGERRVGASKARRRCYADLGEGLLDRFGRLSRVVVRDRAVDVVGDVRGADTVVQPVDQRRVRPMWRVRRRVG